MAPAQQTRQRSKRKTQPKTAIADSNSNKMNNSSRNAAAKGPQEKQRRRDRSSSSSQQSEATKSTASTPGSGPVTDKHARLRQRNREAAQKCRKRKQAGIDTLQTREAAAGDLHSALAAEASQLRGEVLMLKNMVLQHGGCGCAFIEDYIQDQAIHLVSGTSGASNCNSTGSSITSPPIKAEEASGGGEFQQGSSFEVNALPSPGDMDQFGGYCLDSSASSNSSNSSNNNNNKKSTGGGSGDAQFMMDLYYPQQNDEAARQMWENMQALNQPPPQQAFPPAAISGGNGNMSTMAPFAMDLDRAIDLHA